MKGVVDSNLPWGRWVSMPIAAAALMGALMAPAQATEVPQSLRAWLMAIEAVPTPAQLRQAGGPTTEAWLDSVVRDPHEPVYARHRALSFLSLTNTRAGDAHLRRHLQVRDPGLRATAAVAWAAGPGRRAAPGSLAAEAVLLTDPVASVRSAAARSLAWFGDSKAARDLATARRRVEATPDVVRALDRAILQIDEKARR